MEGNDNLRRYSSIGGILTESSTHGALSGVESMNYISEKLPYKSASAAGNSVKTELIETWQLAWPVIGTFLLQMGPGIINVLFLGHLSHEALGIGTLSTMYLNITGLTIVTGLNTAMDTLCPQAVGSGNKKQVGIIFQRSLAIMTVISIPMCISWIYAAKLLTLCGMDENVIEGAGIFIRYSIPGLWGICYYEPLKKYLQTQGIVKPSLYAAGVANVWCAGMNYLLIYVLHWGYIGAALARASCQWVMIFVLLTYMKVTGAGSETWGGFSKDAFKKWPEFFSLAIPGLIMICAEYWAFEIQTLGAGKFGEKYLSAQSVIIQMISLNCMFPMGMGVAASIRIGGYLGQGNAAGAKLAAWVSIGMTAFFCIFTLTTVITLRNEIPKIYTNWDLAIETASQVLPVVGGFLVFDGVQMCCSGVLRGIGKQNIGAIFNAICYYAIGIPLGFYFGFKLEKYTKGLWEGMFIALFLVSTAMLIYIYNCSWDGAVKRALERADAEDQHLAESGYDESTDTVTQVDENAPLLNSK